MVEGHQHDLAHPGHRGEAVGDEGALEAGVGSWGLQFEGRASVLGWWWCGGGETEHDMLEKASGGVHARVN